MRAAGTKARKTQMMCNDPNILICPKTLAHKVGHGGASHGEAAKLGGAGRRGMWRHGEKWGEAVGGKPTRGWAGRGGAEQGGAGRNETGRHQWRDEAWGERWEVAFSCADAQRRRRDAEVGLRKMTSRAPALRDMPKRKIAFGVLECDFLRALTPRLAAAGRGGARWDGARQKCGKSGGEGQGGRRGVAMPDAAGWDGAEGAEAGLRARRRGRCG